MNQVSCASGISPVPGKAAPVAVDDIVCMDVPAICSCAVNWIAMIEWTHKGATARIMAQRTRRSRIDVERDWLILARCRVSEDDESRECLSVGHRTVPVRGLVCRRNILNRGSVVNPALRGDGELDVINGSVGRRRRILARLTVLTSTEYGVSAARYCSVGRKRTNVSR